MAGRRRVRIEDTQAWVFNRMAHAYSARPPYPQELVDVLVGLAGGQGASVVDIGAGIGHLSLPLAARGLRVTAIEPAQAMLAELEGSATARGVAVDARLASAERLPLPDASSDLVLIADALHFLDAALTGQEAGRVLKASGAVAIIQVELADTPFMNELIAIMEESAPRRPRAVANATAHVFALAGLPQRALRLFQDDVPVSHAQLEQILRSISFIGPAMNAQRFHAFRERVLALSAEPVWSRVITLRTGRRPRAAKLSV
jgi:ubiquinone/menaquinone biosynthesis C-methylase UbiE